MIPSALATAEEMQALRGAVALSSRDHVTVLRIAGEGAFPLLDALSSAPLYLREGEMRQTLLLDPAALPFADATVASDEDGYLLLVEGPTEAELLAHIDRHGRPAAGSAEVSVSPLGRSHALFGVDGPYAWELASGLLGPAVLGMTYLSLLHVPDQDILCLRGGKTGEYGYDLLVPRADAETWGARLARLGEGLGAREVGLAALDQAALEGWHFNIRALRGAAAADLTPVELQLQWRVSYDPQRRYVGAEALRARRARGAAVRLTCFSAAGPVAAGDAVTMGERIVGRVLAAGFCHARGEEVGMALLERSLAHPGIHDWRARTGAGEVPLVTRTPPLLDNRSLYVDPHRHSYATRASDPFPPLVADREAGA
jgi:aminomethyltransferase